jgi:hypothetical protein
MYQATMTSVIKKIISIVSNVTFYEPDGETYDMKKTEEIYRRRRNCSYKHIHDTLSPRSECEIEMIKDVSGMTVDKIRSSTMLNQYDFIRSLEYDRILFIEKLQKVLELLENNKDLVKIDEKKYICIDGTIQQVPEILKNLTLYESNTANPYNKYFLDHITDKHIISNAYYWYRNNPVEDTSYERMLEVQQFINDITKESYSKEEAFKIYKTANTMAVISEYISRTCMLCVFTIHADIAREKNMI